PRSTLLPYTTLSRSSVSLSQYPFFSLVVQISLHHSLFSLCNYVLLSLYLSIPLSPSHLYLSPSHSLSLSLPSATDLSLTGSPALVAAFQVAVVVPECV